MYLVPSEFTSSTVTSAWIKWIVEEEELEHRFNDAWYYYAEWTYAAKHWRD